MPRLRHAVCRVLIRAIFLLRHAMLLHAARFRYEYYGLMRASALVVVA